ncbi:MAG TPA: rod shape-determining protein MreC [Bryobacteraceae bacterium]|nr:rod shape-determining protein MreC [Bryobacteraceae bacterium]HOQ43766.1 rod shape-determining protein MreC [Bryobacteraceae bacterium]HPQ15061.1 rod shape-determining protein MreC [Bryobacteraceae bacterium]HPU71791.1 rod shape-determining protein MreC [Bryobacteraceae bacterium]
MDSLLNRYRNITVLLLVICAQLILLAYQVKSNEDVRLIRVWAVTAVTPLARVIEGVRSNTVGILQNYILLHNARQENLEIKKELDRLKLENQYLKSELETADRVKALSLFQARSPSRMVPARVIGTGTGANSRVVFIDRGSRSGIKRGMAVITPDGIVGKIVAAYPTASQVLLVTDPTFAAGVVSQKHRVHGTVRGLGYSSCEVDYIENEQKVEVGEWFFTSGDDGVFPKGLPVGRVTAARPGNPFMQVTLAPSGTQRGTEEVLVIVEGVHQPIPEPETASAEIHYQPPPETPETASAASGTVAPHLGTDADRLRQRYQRIAEAQGHTFGQGLPGSRPPDFNLDPDRPPARGGAAQPGVAKPKPAESAAAAAPPQAQPPKAQPAAGAPQAQSAPVAGVVPAQSSPASATAPVKPQPAQVPPAKADPAAGGQQP